MNSPVKKIGEQNAAIAAHSTRRERNEPGRRAHQMPATIPPTVPTTRPPVSSHRSQISPSAHRSCTGGPPGRITEFPNSRCSSASLTSPSRPATNCSPSYRSGRSTRGTAYVTNVTATSTTGAKARRRRNGNAYHACADDVRTCGSISDMSQSAISPITISSTAVHRPIAHNSGKSGSGGFDFTLKLKFAWPAARHV